MYKICKTEKSIERQKLFQNTLLTMMEKQRFQEITVTSLCKEMEVPRKAFYRYFESLEDVLFVVLDEALTDAFLYLEIKTDLIGFFSYWKKRKSLLDVLEKSGLSAMMVNRIHERLSESIQAQALTNEELRYGAYVSAIMTMLLTWHHSGMKQSVEEMSNEVKHLFKLKD